MDSYSESLRVPILDVRATASNSVTPTAMASTTIHARSHSRVLAATVDGNAGDSNVINVTRPCALVFTAVD